MKTNKPLTDMVAQYLALNSELVDLPEGTSREELKQHIKAGVKQSHPQKTVTVGYTIRVGDLFKPTHDCSVFDGEEVYTLLRDHRLIVLQLSCPQQYYSLINGYWADMREDTVSSVIVMVRATYDPPSLEDIQMVFALRRHEVLISILSMCEHVGNVSHLL